MLVLVLVVLFVVLPVLELALILQVADGIGIPETIAVLILVSIVGGWLCRREGVGVLRRIQASLGRGELPTRDVADGGLILLAGALLVTPGFLSDLLGILLLLPPTRAVIRSVLLAALARRRHLTIVTTTATTASGFRPGAGPRGPGGVIDVTEIDITEIDGP